MGVLRIAEGHGVEFQTIKPAGFRILSALDMLAARLPYDLFITSGTDGAHSGPTDPHKTGEAYDVRSHGLTEPQKHEVVAVLTQTLGPRFYAFLEAPGTPNEHFHVQRAKGTIYP